MALYELHVGAFSPEGTFAGVTNRLDHLVELGVTGLQIDADRRFRRRAQLGL